MAAATVSDSLRALLDSARNNSRLDESSDEEDLQLEDQQALLCTDLLKSLGKLCKSNQKGTNDEAAGTDNNSGNFIHTSINYNNKQNSGVHRAKYAPFSTTNVREVFSDYNASLSRLAPLLSSLMMTRVETEKLLPATQDEEANEAAMSSSSALTLTRPALTAARVYATLLAIPGALGSGLIEMETVSSMAALCKRWRVECVTAMTQIVGGDKQKKKSGKRASGAGAKKRRASKSTTTNPIKRGKQGKRVQIVEGFVSSSDESDDDGSLDEKNFGKDQSFQIDFEDQNDIISAIDLLVLGMQTGLALSQVLWQKEFLSWSSEAREAVVDAVTSIHGTVAALTSSQAARTALPNNVLELQKKVVRSTSLCLQQCILTANSSADDDWENDEAEDIGGPAAKRHETSVFVFRGLFPVLAMQEHLPNGDSGKQAACDIAKDTLQGFVKEVASDVMTKRSDWAAEKNDESTARRDREPRRTRSRSLGRDVTSTPVTTAKKARRKRVSFGALDNSRRTPVLKTTGKLKRRRSSGVTPQSPGGHHAKPRPVLSAVLGLMQKLATSKGLEKAGFRRTVAGTLESCLPHLPSLERTYFLRFMSRLCSSKVSVHRLMVTELLGVVLAEPWLWSKHANAPMLSPVSPLQNSRSPSESPESHARSIHDQMIPDALLEALLGRLSDKVPTVRVSAASSLAKLFSRAAAAEDQNGENDRELRAMIVQVSKALASKRDYAVDCLKHRALNDEKASVRKTSINALADFIFLGTIDDSFPIEEDDVAAFDHLCRDKSTGSRKAAAQGLTTILQQCTQAAGEGSADKLESVARTWTASVLPLALDQDSGCQSKAIELVNQVVFDPIIAFEDTGNMNERCAWKILSIACESSSSACTATNALKAALGKQAMNKSLLQRLCDMATQTIEGPLDDALSSELESQRAGVWYLLDTLVDDIKNLPALYKTLKQLRIDLDFLGNWEKILDVLETKADLPETSHKLLHSCLRFCLRLLSKLGRCVSREIMQRSSAKLRALLENFSLPSDLIAPGIAALTATTISCHEEMDAAQVQRNCEDTASSLYQLCEDSISAYARDLHETGRSSNAEDVDELNVRAIFTTGELATIGFSPDESDAKEKGASTGDDPLRGFYTPPSRKLVDIICTFLPKQFLSTSKSVQSPEIRAHAFICVGKICLRDESLAKQCVSIMAREITEDAENECYSAKSNALLVLGDLCIRYTSLVDKYLPAMACCLQAGVNASNTITVTSDDKSAVVRKNAVILLSSLLLQDYIKFRGLLFFRLLVACVDNDESCAEIAEEMLLGPLLEKNQKLFMNSFVESLFVLNGCPHPIYAAANQSNGSASVDLSGIDLSGPTGRAKRFRMYELMLSKMTGEDKIAVTARIAKDVLEGALSSGILHAVCSNQKTDNDHENAYNVLSDAFAVLSSPMLKVCRGSSSADEDQEDIADPNIPNPTRRVNAIAKGKLLSKISLKHLIEIVFPILRNLKALLQKSQSPLLKDLMQYMVHIYKTYKAEAKDFLSGDPTLLQEIEFDARKKSQSSTSAS
ncbi:Non-SMC condensin II complex, subunit D3 [Seminavis robusta]|uniref:Non-SMC condensin II complex, subunit D3 n=1 Tax=Seminavis robusta TaxID=568900 RepID=A0A9N8DTH8_9STRA|nr:Non-SMC condensin II complex, subunit D3 [Seminavis robusta]|eukprot:Sro345_g122450.1 Non-SMC condensin II complex, subunit D3 (1541) ;mRNA; r:32387-37157